MGLNYIDDQTNHGRPEPSLPVIQHWQPVRITTPIKKVIGHLCSRQGGIESFDSGDRSLGIWPDQDRAEDAVFKAEAVPGGAPYCPRSAACVSWPAWGEAASTASGNFLDLDVDGASEGAECCLDLLWARCVIKAEQPID
jgi:hypothetical protein